MPTMACPLRVSLRFCRYPYRMNQNCDSVGRTPWEITASIFAVSCEDMHTCPAQQSSRDGDILPE